MAIVKTIDTPVGLAAIGLQFHSDLEYLWEFLVWLDGRPIIASSDNDDDDFFITHYDYIGHRLQIDIQRIINNDLTEAFRNIDAALKAIES